MNTSKTNLKIVVTGGAGFIGSHLVHKLIEKNFEVHIIDNLSYGKEKNIHTQAIFHNIDIRDTHGLKKIFREIGEIHCIFHCAAIPMVQFSIDNPEESHDVNVNGTMSLLIASKDSNVRRIVYSASCSTYGDQDNQPFVETMLPLPKSPYALQKYFGECACTVFNTVYGISTVSLRYFNVYGPKQDPTSTYAMVIAKFIDQHKNNQPLTITGNGNQTRDFIFIDDVVNANILAMESTSVGNGEVINIGSGIDTSINTIAKMIGGEISYIPSRLEPKNTRADISHAKKLLGWEPMVSLKEGIRIQKNFKA